jgi:hypothetical protein
MRATITPSNPVWVLITLLLVTGCGDQRLSVVEQTLRQQIAEQSGGALALSSLEKTNGVVQEVGGVQLYTLEWQARIAVQADVWKGGNAFVGHWSDFGVMPAQPTGWNRVLAGGDAQQLIKGATVVLTGSSMLQKTENGWRNLGSEVKTSQILNNVGP